MLPAGSVGFLFVGFLVVVKVERALRHDVSGRVGARFCRLFLVGELMNDHKQQRDQNDREAHEHVGQNAQKRRRKRAVQFGDERTVVRVGADIADRADVNGVSVRIGDRGFLIILQHH